MAKRQNFVVGSGNPVTESKTDAQLNVAWNQLEVLKAGDLDGIFKSVSFYGNDSSNEIANAILALTGSQPTGATETELGAAIKKALEDIQTTSLTFKGYVATSAPSSSTYTLKEGNLWINSSTMPTSFPVAASSIKVWSGSSWATTTETYTAADFDFFRNINDSEGYYWFGGQWKTMSTDMSTTYFSLDSTGKWIINSTYDGSLVHKSGTETISGNKTFSGTNAFSGTTSFGANTTGVTAAVGDNSTKLATTAFVTAATAGGASDQSVVHKAGTETISGVKTFSALPLITATEAATNSKTDTAIPTKGWVNDPGKSTNVLHKDGTEEITGTKTFKNSQIFHKNPNEVDGSNHYNVSLYMQDKNGYHYGCLRSTYTSSNSVSCGVQTARIINGTEKQASLDVGIKEDGTFYTVAPTPKTNTTSNSTEIATVGWANTAGVDSDGNNVNNIVHKSGAETITGTKTISSGGLIYKSTVIDNDVNPSPSQQYITPVAVKDKNDKMLGDLAFTKLQNGKNMIYLQPVGYDASKSTPTVYGGYLGISCNKDGTNTQTTAPTPATSANDTQIATTAWVRTVTTGAPDWQNAITLSTGIQTYTATSNGWIVVESRGARRSLSVIVNNRQVVGLWVNEDDWSVQSFPVSRGDVISYEANTSAVFIPSK